MILAGREVANSLKEKIVAYGREQSPVLAILQLIDDPSLKVYLNSRLKIADQIGIDVESFNLNGRSYEDIKTLIQYLNYDSKIWGIMIDHPFPKDFNEQEIIDLIDPKKDVECLTTANLNKVFDKKHVIAPPVASAVIELAKHYNVELKGKKTCVVGDSIVVGKPIAALLEKEGCIVTTFNKKNFHLKEDLKPFEIIVSATGNAEFIKSENVPENAVLFDIGTNINSKKELCGDFEKGCYEKALHYSPSPGGVGPITTTLLFYNLFKLRGIIDD